MKVFRVDRTNKISYGEDFSMVIVAEDKLHAERKARWESDDFKKATLKVVEIKLNEEKVILKAFTSY